MSRLLAAGQVEEYATHLTADYARTTRAQPHHQDVRASAGAVAARGAPQFRHRGALTPNPQAARTAVVEERHKHLEDPPCLRIVAQSGALSC